MDPRLLYTDFLMDGEEVMLQPTTDAKPTFKDDRGYTYCTLEVFQSDDPDLARDPLSTNRRLQETADLENDRGRSYAGTDLHFDSGLPLVLLWMQSRRPIYSMSWAFVWAQPRTSAPHYRQRDSISPCATSRFVPL